MKKVILVPDSFKGSISSVEACSIMEKAIVEEYPECEVKSIPVADGGEGTVDAFLRAVGGERHTVSVTGPFFGEKVNADYAVLSNGIAVMEVASTVGLPLVEGRTNPGEATSFGVGEILKAIAAQGIKHVVIGLGGSCSNDAGAGAAAACGVVFQKRDGKEFIPVGNTLGDVFLIDKSKMDSHVFDMDITVMCDVDNPFWGPEGAAFVYAPQKGADTKEVIKLDNALCKLADVIDGSFGIDLQKVPGSGAAGGMGGGFLVFFGARMKMGIDALLDTVGFDEMISGTDIVFTGEGRLDTQSLRGKVVTGVMKRAWHYGVKTVAFVGDIGDGVDSLYDEGIAGIFSINRVAVPFSEARKRSKNDLYLTVKNVIKYTHNLFL